MSISTLSENDINKLWKRLDQEANEKKNSHEALVRLQKDYKNWDSDTQRKAGRVFGQWLASDNSRKRFDAISLIDELSIMEVAKDMKQHQQRLKTISGPEAKNELDRVNKILARFENS